MKNILKDLSHEELIEIKKQLETSIASADKKQSALKILLNSLYGACANNYFRFFSTAIAEGITMSGQYIIQQVAADIDVYLNKVCETEGLKYVFYVDTDSNYLTLNTIAN